MAALIPALLQILLELADMDATAGHPLPLEKRAGAYQRRMVLRWMRPQSCWPIVVAQTMEFKRNGRKELAGLRPRR
jgi:hypothetical protein